VEAEDFDGDGHADLAVANYSSDDVSILRGNGDGTFQAEVRYGAGDAPRSIEAADFNGDEHADLAVVNSSYYSEDVSILLGNGDGTFQADVRYSVGRNPSSAVAEDLNEDGNPDLVVTSFYDDNISVLLGIGDGTFQDAVSYDAGFSPDSAEAADFNGDGHVDIAVANTSALCEDVSILRGKGDGSFRFPVQYGAGKWPCSVEAEDFNSDGRPDLAVVNCYSDDISVFLQRSPYGFPFTLQLDASYEEGLLLLDFSVGTPEPALWTALLILRFPTIVVKPLWSFPLPAIDPPIDLPISVPFPSIGWAAIYTALSTAAGRQADDIDFVYTARPLPRLRPASGGTRGVDRRNPVEQD